MNTNAINRRELIEEEVYDEFPSSEIFSKSDCEIEYNNMKSNETTILRNWKELLSVCVNSLLPAFAIFAISLG